MLPDRIPSPPTPRSPGCPTSRASPERRHGAGLRAGRQGAARPSARPDRARRRPSRSRYASRTASIRRSRGRSVARCDHERGRASRRLDPPRSLTASGGPSSSRWRGRATACSTATSYVAVCTEEAPRGRLVRIPIATAADRQTWVELIPESDARAPLRPAGGRAARRRCAARGVLGRDRAVARRSQRGARASRSLGSSRARRPTALPSRRPRTRVRVSPGTRMGSRLCSVRPTARAGLYRYERGLRARSSS